MSVKKITAGISSATYGIINPKTANVSKTGVLANAINDATKDVVEVDSNVDVPTDITVPKNKKFVIDKGKILSGAGKLKIDTSDIEFPHSKVFGDTFDVIFTERATRWRDLNNWGAPKLQNFRSNVPDGENPDSHAQIVRTIASGDSINYVNQRKNYVVALHLDGAYGVTDTIAVTSRTVIFDGVSQAAGGSCLKYIGSMNAPDVTKPILRFDGANHSMIRNLAFNAPITGSAEAAPLFAAIQTISDPELNFPQRRIVIENVTVGSPIGNENTAGNYWEFEHGLICGTGVYATDYINSNNDFFTISNFTAGRCKIGIKNCYDQAVDWNYRQIAIIDCGIGMSFPRGGSFELDGIYFDRGTREGCILGPVSNSDTLRFSMKNVSMEHTPSQYFLRSQGPVIGNFTTGFIDVAFDQQFIQNGLFELVGGGCMSGPSLIKFERMTFRSSGTGKIFIDATGLSNNSRRITFDHCNGAEFIWFRFPAAATAADFTEVEIIGRFRDGSTNRMQSVVKRISKSNPHTTYDAVNNCYWLMLGDTFEDKSTDICVRKIEYGDKGFEPTTMWVKDTRMCSFADANTLTATDMIPKDAMLESVVVLPFDSNNTPFQGKISVGTPNDPDAFGDIVGTAARIINSNHCFTPQKYHESTAVVLKGFNADGTPGNMFPDKYFTLTVEYKLYGIHSGLSFDGAALNPAKALI